MLFGLQCSPTLPHLFPRHLCGPLSPSGNEALHLFQRATSNYEPTVTNRFAVMMYFISQENYISILALSKMDNF